MLEKKLENIDRLEVINHAKNDKSIGRLLTLYKELGHFDKLEFALQDNDKTLKIFLTSKKDERRKTIQPK